jgi:hypothetical protein
MIQIKKVLFREYSGPNWDQEEGGDGRGKGVDGKRVDGKGVDGKGVDGKGVGGKRGFRWHKL